METGNIKKEEDKWRLKEIKEKIQKYKEELRKGTEFDEYMKNEKNTRMSYHTKNIGSLDAKLKESIIKKIENEDNRSSKYRLNKENNPNDINFNTIEYQSNDKRDIIETKQLKTIDNKDLKKEKKEENNTDRNKSYSRAMDRFKKRYKKDNNSQEFKNKRSEKINEMARKLENVIGKQGDSTEIKDEIVHEPELRNNFEELLENKPVVAKKTKKARLKFQL